MVLHSLLTREYLVINLEPHEAWMVIMLKICIAISKDNSLEGPDGLIHIIFE